MPTEQPPENPEQQENPPEALPDPSVTTLALAYVSSLWQSLRRKASWCWPSWVKAGLFIDGIRALRNKLSGSSSFWTALATIVIAIATVMYTCTATMQWSVMRSQLDVMVAAQRPWLGCSEIRPTQEPRTTFYKPDAQQLYLQVACHIQNYGTSPAFAVNTSVTFIYPTATITRKLVHGACERAKAFTQGGIGQVIFPGSTFTYAWGELNSFDETRELPSFEVRICIAYHDAAHHMHHTQLWLHSTSSPDAVWRELNPGYPFRYRQVTGFEVWTQEAD